MKLYILSIIFLISVFDLSGQVHKWDRSNPGGGGVFNHIEASIIGDIIACSDLSGAYLSKDGGNSWEILGATSGFKETHCSAVGFHKTDSDIFCLGTEHGIYQTIDRGDTLVQALDNGYVSDIDYALNNPAIAYACYHPSFNSVQGAIYKSSDNGASWIEISEDLPDDLRLLKIIVDPSDDNTVYVLSGDARFGCSVADVFRSTNGGINWTNLTASLQEIMDMCLDPFNTDKLYVTCINADCDAQYYWTNLDGYLMSSEDQGDAWDTLSNYVGIIWPDLETENEIRLIDPRQPYEWISSAGTWTSTDGGVHFNKTGDVLDWDTFFNDELFHSYGKSPHGLCATLSPDRSDPSTIFWCTNQYVYKSTDDGQTFESLFTNEQETAKWKSTGVDNINLFEIESSPADPNIIYAAYFDLGVWRSLDKGNTWTSCNVPEFTGSRNAKGGNGNTLLADPVRDSILWASMSRNQTGKDPTFLLKNTSKGDTSAWTEITDGLVKKEIMGLSLDPNSPDDNRTLYVSSEGDVYKSEDDGSTWDKIYDCNRCRFTAVDPVDSDVIYAGGGEGLFRSLDGGDSWVDISHPEMPATGNRTFWNANYDGVFDVQTDPNNASWVYVIAHGDEKGLYRSKDQGDSWTKLITNDYMRRVLVAPTDSNIVYATSSRAFKSGHYNENSKGVYFSQDCGESWTLQNQGMEYTFGFALEIDHEEAPTVFVGSPGSGIQKSLVYKEGDEHITLLEDCIKVSENPYDHHVKIIGVSSNYSIQLKNENDEVIENLNAANSPILINTSSLPMGLHFIEIEHQNIPGVYLKKIIKE